MLEKQITLNRHNAPDWVFTFDDYWSGFIHKTKNNTYQLFFGGLAEVKPIWIGRLSNDASAWVTWEKEAKAKAIKMINCDITFGV